MREKHASLSMSVDIEFSYPVELSPREFKEFFGCQVVSPIEWEEKTWGGLKNAFIAFLRVEEEQTNPSCLMCYS